MNCYFCQNDITKYRLIGLTKPAGIFYCKYCTKTHDLYNVTVAIGTNQAPIEAYIHIDRQYVFRIDYYSNKTYLLSRQLWRHDETVVTADNTSVTPTNAHNKFKTYLLFS